MAYKEEYFLKNKVKINQKNREWYYKNRDRVLTKRKKDWLDPQKRLLKKISNKKWRTKYKEIINRKSTLYQKNRYLEIISILGDKCCRCGFDKIGALQVHHKISRVKEHKRDFIKKSYDLSRVELICANCHCLEHEEERKIFNLKYK